jgi:hypothetical protein
MASVKDCPGSEVQLSRIHNAIASARVLSRN